MKNKKLFAILTLVCFMFTLMPVAAFAADAELDDTYIKNTSTPATTDLLIEDATTDTVYVFAVKDDVIYRGMNVTGVTAVENSNGIWTVSGLTAAGSTFDGTATLSFDNGGTYTVYVAEYAGAGLAAIVTGAEYVTAAELVDTMIGASEASATMTKNTVTVKVDEDAVYDMVFTAVDATTVANTADGADVSNIDANAGFANGVISVNLTENGVAVKNAALEYSTVGYVNVTPIDAKTDRNGDADFKISATKAGNFKVYVKYNGYKEVLSVAVGTTGVENVSVVAEPKAPTALDTTIYNDSAVALDGVTALNYTGVVFKLTDANGTVETGAAVGIDYTVTVIKKPADSVLGTTSALLALEYVAAEGGYVLVGRYGDVVFDAEGDYTFRVALENGASATASVTVKEMGDVVKIMFVKAPTTVAYGEGTTVNKVVAVDANGVTDATITPVTLSASGKAIDTFNNGALTVKDDEKYIGSTITVLAKYDEFVATTDLVVVDQAAEVVYTSTNAEVGINNTLIGNIMDANGKATSVGNGVATTAQAIVLDKPANAIVVADVQGDALNAKGQVVLDFLASVAGEYKVQTIVEYDADTDGNGTPDATKYISSITTITVGATEGQFKDVIVMSIGANKLVKNSSIIEMPVAPEIVDSRTMVPARAGLEAFGAVVVWDEATQTVTAELDGVKVVMTIGEKVYTVNGKAVVGDAAPYITTASTMVPVSFFTNAFGITATAIYDDYGVCDVLFTK